LETGWAYWRPTGIGAGETTGAGTGPDREGASEPWLVDGTLGLEFGDRLCLLVGDPLGVMLLESLGLALCLAGARDSLVSEPRLSQWWGAHWGLNLERGWAYWLKTH
jgi:hypothetical protein